MGKPALVMRETTERQEAIDAGLARLVGTDQASLVSSVSAFLELRDPLCAGLGRENPSATVIVGAHCRLLRSIPQSALVTVP